MIGDIVHSKYRKKALELGLEAIILKESSKRELCMMGMKSSHRVKIIPK
jgi:hypothetical protein